mmetsp:Transcript_3482/g.5777  ORF Transcript_3482/g.5777 Transcript_3482/m.5777 type:complete len:98 (-) Transcript_3482:469-762(-)
MVCENTIGLSLFDKSSQCWPPKSHPPCQTRLLPQFNPPQLTSIIHYKHLLDNNIMPKMSQYQRKKRQQPKQRKCQIGKNDIPKHTPMLILNKRRKHE